MAKSIVVGRKKRNNDNAFAASTLNLVDQYRRDVAGQWTDNRLEQSSHYRGAIYVAIRALMDALYSATIQINRKHRKYHATSLRRLEKALIDKALPTPHANSEDEQFRPFDDPDHSLVKLIDRPNRTETFNELLAQVVLQYHLTGSALLWGNPNGFGVPAELYVLPTALCYAQPATPTFPEGWWQVTSYYPSGGYGVLPAPFYGGGAPVDARDVFVFKNPHPLWRWDAMSPLTACATQLDVLEAIDISRWSAMESGLTPDMVLMAPGVNQSQLDVYLERLKQTNIGKRNHRKVMAIGGDQGDAKFDVKWPANTARDMDFSGGWDQMIAFALAAFGVPKSVASLATTGSYAELYAALKQFHTLTLRPLVARMGVWLTKNLAHMWGRDLAIQIDLPTIDDQQLQETQLQTDLAHDGLTYNEYRAIRGRKPVPGGDVLCSVYVQQQQAKAQQAAQAMVPPQAQQPGAAAPDQGQPQPPDQQQQAAAPQGPASPNAGGDQPQPDQQQQGGDPLSQLLGTPQAGSDEGHVQNAVADAALQSLGVPADEGAQFQKAWEPYHLKASAIVKRRASVPAPGSPQVGGPSPRTPKVASPAGEPTRTPSPADTPKSRHDDTNGQQVIPGPSGKTFATNAAGGASPAPKPQPVVAPPAPKVTATTGPLGNAQAGTVSPAPPANQPQQNAPAGAATSPQPNAPAQAPWAAKEMTPDEFNALGHDDHAQAFQRYPNHLKNSPQFARNADDAIKQGYVSTFADTKTGGFDADKMSAYRKLLADRGYQMGPATHNGATVSFKVTKSPAQSAPTQVAPGGALRPGGQGNPQNLGKAPAPNAPQPSNLPPAMDRAKIAAAIAAHPDVKSLAPNARLSFNSKLSGLSDDALLTQAKQLGVVHPEAHLNLSETEIRNRVGNQPGMLPGAVRAMPIADIYKEAENAGIIPKGYRPDAKMRQHLLNQIQQHPEVVKEPLSQQELAHLQNAPISEVQSYASKLGINTNIPRTTPAPPAPPPSRIREEEQLPPEGHRGEWGDWFIRAGDSIANRISPPAPAVTPTHSRAELIDAVRNHPAYAAVKQAYPDADTKLEQFSPQKLQQALTYLDAQRQPAKAIPVAPPADPATVKAMVQAGQEPPPEHFAQAAESIKPLVQYSPQAQAVLARASDWAGNHAERLADRVANHFGIDRERAKQILQRAIVAVADHAAGKTVQAGTAVGASGQISGPGGSPLTLKVSPKRAAARQLILDLAEHVRGGHDLSHKQAAELAQASNHVPHKELEKLNNSLTSSMTVGEKRTLDRLTKATAKATKNVKEPTPESILPAPVSPNDTRPSLGRSLATGAAGVAAGALTAGQDALGQILHPPSPTDQPQPAMVTTAPLRPRPGAEHLPPGAAGSMPSFGPTPTLTTPQQPARRPEEDVAAPAPSSAQTPSGESPAPNITSTSPGQPAAIEHNPNVEETGPGGITKASRVGVPADEVPDRVPTLPNLTPYERSVEHGFKEQYDKNPDGMADKFLRLVNDASQRTGSPPTFGTDDAKALSNHWSSEELDKNLEQRSKNRATLNLALHQTANAIAKRAFLKHLDTLKPGDKVMVTVGGVGAGKGYGLELDKETGKPRVPEAYALAKQAKAIWDSAGDQNATENPWIQKELEKRGLKGIYAFTHTDPYEQWTRKGRGVVHRANNPKDGRMVDAHVFADSYALGARNHHAFHQANLNNPNAEFVFMQDGKLIPGVPTSARNLDRHHLARHAIKTLHASDAPEHVKLGGSVGSRIWGAPPKPIETPKTKTTLAEARNVLNKVKASAAKRAESRKPPPGRKRFPKPGDAIIRKGDEPEGSHEAEAETDE